MTDLKLTLFILIIRRQNYQYIHFLKLFYQFYFKYLIKNDMIKWNTLKRRKQMTGSVEHKLKALKASWVQRLSKTYFLMGSIMLM